MKLVSSSKIFLKVTYNLKRKFRQKKRGDFERFWLCSIHFRVAWGHANIFLDHRCASPIYCGFPNELFGPSPSGIHNQFTDLLKWLVHSLRYLLCLVVNWILHHFLVREKVQARQRTVRRCRERYTFAEGPLSHERPAQRHAQLTRA